MSYRAYFSASNMCICDIESYNIGIFRNLQILFRIHGNRPVVGLLGIPDRCANSQGGVVESGPPIPQKSS